MPEIDMYALRRVDEGTEPTKSRGLNPTLDDLAGRLRDHTDGPRFLQYDGADGGRGVFLAGVPEVRERIALLFGREKGPDRIIVWSDRGPKYAIRRLPKPEFVVPNGAGTAAVDRIGARVRAEFGGRWLVRDMGICVDKPGEHGYCNAQDLGTNMDIPAEQTWFRINEMAQYIRWLAVTDQAPVFGVIVLEKWAGIDSGWDWRPYSGVRHSTHVHYSGAPSRSGWV